MCSMQKNGIFWHIQDETLPKSRGLFFKNRWEQEFRSSCEKDLSLWYHMFCIMSSIFSSLVRRLLSLADISFANSFNPNQAKQNAWHLTTNWVGKHALTNIIISSLLCHSDTMYKEWLKSFNYFKGLSMHKHYYGQNLKLKSAVVTLSIRSKSSKSNCLFSVSKQCIYANLVEIHPMVKKTEIRKCWFLQDGDLENLVTVTKIFSTLPFATMIQYIELS